MRSGVVAAAILAVSIAGQGWAGSAGQIDETFGIRGRVDGVPCLYDVLAVQSGNKMVVAGFNQQDGTCFARVLADGSQDPSFGVGGIVATPDRVLAGQLRADSTGALVAKLNIGVSTLLRYLPNGTLDPDFASAGTLVVHPDNGTVRFALQADDAIITAHLPVLGNDQVVVRRYLTDGSLDPSFGTLGEVALTGLGLVNQPTGFYKLFDVVVGPDGKIVVVASYGLVRLLADGALDTTFGVNGYVAANFLLVGGGLGVQADGKILVTVDGNIKRFSASGAIDGTFGVAGIVQGARLVRVGADGRFLAFTSGGIARFLPNGTPDPSFASGGSAFIPLPIGSGGQAGVLSDGRIVAGGGGRIVALYAGTCGDGVDEPGEECDDGNMSAGDGCDASCCVADTDGDGLCDSYETCGAPAAIEKGRFKMSGGFADRFAQAFVVKGQAVLQPGIDPATTGFRLVFRIPRGIVSDEWIPAGAGWSVSGVTSRWEGNVPPGVERVVIRTQPATPGLVKVKIRGHGPLYYWDGFVDLPISYELIFPDNGPANGQCAEATFPGPPPLPSCVRKGDIGASCR